MKWTMILLLGFAFAGTGCALMDAGSDEPAPQPIAYGQLHDVRAARQSLIGKTRQEIVDAVGSPDRQAGNGEREWWTYTDRFQDSVTQRRLPVVTFAFHREKLEGINF